MIKHIPVMENEFLEYLRTDNYFVDMTTGTGGHTKKMLENTGCFAICIDLDFDQLFIAKENLSNFSNRFFLINSNYKDIGNIIKIQVDSILLDAGLSSFQLDSDRGFSFKNNGFLDMRFNRKSGITAYDAIRDLTVDEISRILKEYGDVKNHYFIAKKIKENLPKTSFELKSLLLKYIRKRVSKEIAKIFQSLRIYVNKELENLENGIKGAYSILKENGRLCVITYHSREDKVVVKTAKEVGFKKIVKGKKPKIEEIMKNRKARSAKLRVFEK